MYVLSPLNNILLICLLSPLGPVQSRRRCRCANYSDHRVLAKSWKSAASGSIKGRLEQ